jgi:serine/threonine-protein kinase RsbW
VAYASSLARSHGVPPERLWEFELATEEAVMNICRYAYPEGDGELTVRIWPDASELIVELIDSGVPFDPLARPDPDTTLPLEERPIGGLGVMLIRRSVDRVSYRRCDGCNVLTLVMALPP